MREGRIMVVFIGGGNGRGSSASSGLKQEGGRQLVTRNGANRSIQVIETG